MKPPVLVLQRGMSLVELMVGITIGLFVVAAATTLASTQLVDNRRLLLEVQIQQDLRASMDIIARQLRRAGGVTPSISQNFIAASDGSPGVSDPNARMSNSSTSVDFAFFYKGDNGPYGFKLDGGVIQTRLTRSTGVTVWQDLTDARTVNVTRLLITLNPLIAGPVLPCPKLCLPSNDTSCWPTMVRRSYRIELDAQSVRDPSVKRELRSDVQIRNDWVRVNDPALGTSVCPL